MFGSTPTALFRKVIFVWKLFPFHTEDDFSHHAIPLVLPTRRIQVHFGSGSRSDLLRCRAGDLDMDPTKQNIPVPANMLNFLTYF
jgi:hypothetical protein